jgi:CHAT domain-containing protein
MYPRQGSRVYYGEAATESAFKQDAPRSTVIHFAGHAIVDDRAPLYSALVLATASPSEDGLLEAREVADLSLDAALVVLSACETARGEIGTGEGVIGLSWAFFAAGCPTAVVSQWRAESAATAQLMIEFHRRLRGGGTTAEALREAQRTIRRSAGYRHPFYWAPFIAIGAADGPTDR